MAKETTAQGELLSVFYRTPPLTVTLQFWDEHTF